MKKAVVILGAGASYDVHNGVVPVTNASLRPPLARELFEDRFWNWRSVYPGAEVLGAVLGRMALTQSAPFNLEERLTEYANNSDRRTRRAFKDIPPYLRDIVTAVSAAYVPSPSSYIVLAQRLLRDETHEIMFVSLNYDTLLEKALVKYDSGLVFESTDDYIAAGRQAHLVKIHGSCNWGVPIPRTGGQDDPRVGWPIALEEFEPTGQSPKLIVVNDAGSPSHDWRGPDGRILYPRLTAPLLDKTLCCPEEHTEALQNFMADCHKFLIIGTSWLDRDLLDCMAETCAGRGHVVYYVNSDVNSEGATEQTKQRFEEAIRAFVLSGPQTPLPRTSVQGFTVFLDTPELEAFLAAD